MTQNTKIILGSPGTGKTTYLLDVLESELKRGVPPNKIAFCSFTKKSVAEATDRACDRFGFSRSDMVYFRTIHSMAFFSLGLKKTQVLQGADYRKIGKHLGLAFSNRNEFITEGYNPHSKQTGDQYSFIDGFSRARHCNARDVWDSINHDNLNWFEFERYSATVAEYKKDKGLYDFADMLEQGGREIDVDVLIVDEAQDLSTAQWGFIDATFKRAKRVYIGGDDDQAIFEWSGADVDRFINLKGERVVLTQSHRVPRSVHDLAEGISSRITNRSNKSYNARAVKGSVEYWPEVDHIDMSTGTWLLLARNSYLLGELAVTTKQRGYCYTLKGNSSVSKQDVEAIELWGKYLKGLILTDIEKIKLSEYTSDLEKKVIWHEAFDRMEAEDREYYVSMLRRGESIKAAPRIAISTIHGSKGGEADNVVLLSDLAYTTWESMNMNQNSEHRVWYVGATRAKESLHIIMPRGRYNYPI